ncbi:hypothetical protein K438DRAFT_1856242 [Mycena galopus ATCC 62051]|nr:hypothetical protein K438DRAFT_1856242 [Mycena galopus ATCC 62051]
MDANPDIQGYFVRLCNFITHIGPSLLQTAILIAWSPKSPRSYYGLLFSQIFSILISVFISIGRNQISISDAEFAVLLTRSPICAYCVLMVLPRFFIKAFPNRIQNATQHLKRGAWKELLADLNCRVVTDGLCGFLALILCLALDISVRFNGTTHLYSPVQCGDAQCWRSHHSDRSVHRCVALGIASLAMYECVLARHKRLRWNIMRTLAARYPSIKKTIYWKRGVCGFCAAWYITAKLHPWIPFVCVAILFEDWSRKLNIWTVESDFVFSYGQVLAILPAAPDVIWIVTGRGKPWGAEEPEIDDIWAAFPADEVQHEAGLPTRALEFLPLRNESGISGGTGSETAHLSSSPEIDLGELSLTRRNRGRKRRRGRQRGTSGATPQVNWTIPEIDLGGLDGLL